MYIQLKQDRENKLLTEEQFQKALAELNFGAKKRHPRQSKLSGDEKQRRKELRTLTKWFFDIELFRETTPLYKTDSLVMSLFLDLANKIIDHASDKPVVSSSKRDVLIKTILEIVKNRPSQGNYFTR